MSTVLLPEGADEMLLETIMKEQHEACCGLGVSVVGGHTEVAPSLTRPIISGFMLGEVSKENLMASNGVNAGDAIVLTRGAGIEGTGILAVDLRHRLEGLISFDTLDRAAEMLKQISVVPEALKASKVGGVHVIHTPTEGGVYNGLLEVSEASGLGVKVYESKLLLAPETKEICEALDVDPFKLLSSGSLIIVVDPSKARDLIKALAETGVKARMIGEMTSNPSERLIIGRDGSVKTVDEVKQDELYRVLGSN
jgi:hydrogenase maturation factor